MGDDDASEKACDQQKGVADVKSVADLDEDGLRAILRRHFDDEELEVVEVGDLSEVAECTKDYFFSSEVRNATVKIKRGGEDSEEEELHLVVKTPSCGKKGRLEKVTGAIPLSESQKRMCSYMIPF